MRKFMIALGAAALFATSFATQAATTNIGELTSLSDDGYSALVGYSRGSFSEVVSFDIASDTSSFSVLASKTSFSLLNLISGFTATLTGSNGFSTLLSYSSGAIGTTYGQVLGYESSLAAGHYDLTFSGTATRAGNFVVALAAPVPEPETYAMLLSGLALLGVVARRRKKHQDTLAA